MPLKNQACMRHDGVTGSPAKEEEKAKCLKQNILLLMKDLPLSVHIPVSIQAHYLVPTTGLISGFIDGSYFKFHPNPRYILHTRFHHSFHSNYYPYSLNHILFQIQYQFLSQKPSHYLRILERNLIVPGMNRGQTRHVRDMVESRK